MRKTVEGQGRGEWKEGGNERGWLTRAQRASLRHQRHGPSYLTRTWDIFDPERDSAPGPPGHSVSRADRGLVLIPGK